MRDEVKRLVVMSQEVEIARFEQAIPVQRLDDFGCFKFGKKFFLIEILVPKVYAAFCLSLKLQGAPYHHREGVADMDILSFRCIIKIFERNGKYVVQVVAFHHHRARVHNAGKPRIIEIARGDAAAVCPDEVLYVVACMFLPVDEKGAHHEIQRAVESGVHVFFVQFF